MVRGGKFGHILINAFVSKVSCSNTLYKPIYSTSLFYNLRVRDGAGARIGSMSAQPSGREHGLMGLGQASTDPSASADVSATGSKRQRGAIPTLGQLKP